MNDTRQLTLGILAGLVSAALLLGSVSLALLEGSLTRVPAPSPTFITLTPSPQPTTSIPVATTSPGTGTTSTPTITPTPSPSLTFTSLPTSPCNYPADWHPIEVYPGDTLESLAATYGTTVEALIDGNCLDTTTLMPGTILYVPGVLPAEPTDDCGPYPGWVYYTVRVGDTLYSLSLYFGVTVEELQFANCLTDTVIRVGQKLFVPNIPTPTYAILPTNPPTRTPTPIPTVTSTRLPPPTATPTATRYPEPTDVPTEQQPTMPVDPTEQQPLPGSMLLED